MCAGLLANLCWEFHHARQVAQAMRRASRRLELRREISVMAKSVKSFVLGMCPLTDRAGTH
jgi:hypothetical protein